LTYYKSITNEYRHIAKKYTSKSETAKISEPIMYENRMYYCIVYYSTFLGIPKNDMCGRLIVDDNFEAVTDKFLLRELNKFFYYSSIFFGYEIVDIGKAIKSDAEMKRDEEDYNDAYRVLDYIYINKEVKEAQNVKDVFETYFNTRVETNDALKHFDNRIKGYKNNNAICSKEIIEELLDLYRDILVKNFEQVKKLNAGADYYDAVKRETKKIKRLTKLKLDTKFQISATKLYDLLSFAMNLLSYYGEVINYSTNQYTQYYISKEDERIQEEYNKIRN